MTKSESRLQEIYQEHLAIVRALQARDKEKAKAEVVKHLNIVLEHIKSTEQI